MNGKDAEVNGKKAEREKLDALSYCIIGVALRIHTRLGPGLLESVYEEVFADDLARRGLNIERQKEVPIVFDDRYFAKGYRADLIVERRIVGEIKSLERTAPVHVQQLITYARLADYPVCLLFNFGEARLRDGIKRIVNKY